MSPLVSLAFSVFQPTCGMESPSEEPLVPGFSLPKLNIIRGAPPSEQPMTRQKPVILLQRPFIATPMEAEHTVIRNIIEKKFPYLNHLFIVDAIKKDVKARSLYENEKTFIFTKLADCLYEKGLQFINEWGKKRPNFNKIREICKNYTEKGQEIYGKHEEYILFLYGTAFYNESYMINTIYFVSNAFFDPCLYYYTIAKSYSQIYTARYDEYLELIKSKKESFSKPQNIPSSAPP